MPAPTTSTAFLSDVRPFNVWFMGLKVWPNTPLEQMVSSGAFDQMTPLEMLKEEGLFEKLQDKICIGQGYRGQTGKLGVGNCTRKFEHHLGGCPPLENEIYEFLKKYIQDEKNKI